MLVACNTFLFQGILCWMRPKLGLVRQPRLLPTLPSSLWPLPATATPGTPPLPLTAAFTTPPPPATSTPSTPYLPLTATSPTSPPPATATPNTPCRPPPATATPRTPHLPLTATTPTPPPPATANPSTPLQTMSTPSTPPLLPPATPTACPPSKPMSGDWKSKFYWNIPMITSNIFASKKLSSLFSPFLLWRCLNFYVAFCSVEHTTIAKLHDNVIELQRQEKYEKWLGLGVNIEKSHWIYQLCNNQSFFGLKTWPVDACPALVLW